MEPTIPQIPPPAPRPNWWSRNWKWFVPTGCLSLFVLVIALATAIVFLVFGALKSTDVYRTSMARARANPEVAEALGSPLKEGMFLSGSTHVNGASGTADLAIPISGPKGKGTIYVTAEKSAGEWSYSKLLVEVAKTKARINLDGNDAAADQE